MEVESHEGDSSTPAGFEKRFKMILIYTLLDIPSKNIVVDNTKNELAHYHPGLNRGLTGKGRKCSALQNGTYEGPGCAMTLSKGPTEVPRPAEDGDSPHAGINPGLSPPRGSQLTAVTPATNLPTEGLPTKHRRGASTAGSSGGRSGIEISSFAVRSAKLYTA